MENLGVGRFERIAGEWVRRAPKGPARMVAEVLLLNWLQGAYGDLFVLVGPQIEVHREDSPANEPRAGLGVLVRSARELTANPRPDDLRMVAEVSDSTISFDLKVKAPLYARAGIGEYWVVDVERRRVIVHRQPEEGVYRDVAVYGEDEQVATLGAPEQSIRVGELF